MLKPQDVPNTDDPRSVEADLDRVLMTAFCRALDASHLSPVAVISAMAGALGSVYRQVAATHRNQQCPCGWQPTTSQDIELLQAAFKAAALRQPDDQLLTMQVLGRA